MNILLQSKYTTYGLTKQKYVSGIGYIYYPFTTSPPLMCITCPVIKEASSDARKT
jgi:hypothetical protein